MVGPLPHLLHDHSLSCAGVNARAFLHAATENAVFVLFRIGSCARLKAIELDWPCKLAVWTLPCLPISRHSPNIHALLVEYLTTSAAAELCQLQSNTRTIIDMTGNGPILRGKVRSSRTDLQQRGRQLVSVKGIREQAASHLRRSAGRVLIPWHA